MRIAFDPEAMPEHPGAQLASYGTPLIDRLLADAVEARPPRRALPGRPEPVAAGLDGRLRRAVTLPPGFGLEVESVRPLHFPQAVFWFQATFVSDQKEQEILPVALDLHYGRQVRHLELLDRSRLAEEPWTPLPEARHPGLAAAYPIARDRVVRTLAALANTRHRELLRAAEPQLERMGRYYADLRAEVEEQVRRAEGRGEDLARFAARLEALDREEQLRVAELRQKSQLQVHLRLLNLLVIHQPKLLLRTAVIASAGPVPGRPAGVGLGPAGRGRRGRRLPRVPPPDVRIRRHPPGPARLPGLRGRQASGPTMTLPDQQVHRIRISSPRF